MVEKGTKLDEMVTLLSAANKVGRNEVLRVFGTEKKRALAENNGQLKAANPLWNLENAAHEAGVSWVINAAMSPLVGNRDAQL